MPRPKSLREIIPKGNFVSRIENMSLDIVMLKLTLHLIRLI
jgi:hypothetical protein